MQNLDTNPISFQSLQLYGRKQSKFQCSLSQLQKQDCFLGCLTTSLSYTKLCVLWQTSSHMSWGFSIKTIG